MLVAKSCRAKTSDSDRPYANMRSRSSCMCFVNADPTAVASILIQRKMEASDGAFLRLVLIYSIHQSDVEVTMR